MPALWQSAESCTGCAVCVSYLLPALVFFLSFCCLLPGRMLIVYLWLLWQECWLSVVCMQRKCAQSSGFPLLKSLPMLVRCFSSSTTHLNCPQGVNLGSAEYLPNISTAISFRFGNSFSKMWQMYDKHHPGFFPLCSICGKLLPCVCFALFFLSMEKKERKRETEWLQYINRNV